MTRSFIRAGRGRGKGHPHIENPADEISRGQPAPAPEALGPIARRPDGRFATPEAAREAGRRAGRVSAERRRQTTAFATGLRLAPAHRLFEVQKHVAPFLDEAERWFQAKCAECAAEVGGGKLSAGVVSILRTAAWQTYQSRALFEMAAGPLGVDVVRDGSGQPAPQVNDRLLTLASKLGDSARQNLLAAHSLAAEEAKARRAHGPTTSAHAQLLAGLADEGDDS